jgi:AcrR family transcriptional regulator
VTTHPAPPDARKALLAQVIDHYLTGGRTDGSLRSLAAAIGTSHRMLLYHFSSFEGLVDDVVDEVEARQRLALSGLATQSGDPRTLSRRFWQLNSAPQLAPLARLFFTLYARLLERGDSERAARLVDAWLGPATELLRVAGVPLPRARVLARLGLAVTRGLLLDLLATDDRRAVNAAMYAYIDLAFDGKP